MSEETVDFSSIQTIQAGMHIEIPPKKDTAQKDEFENNQLISEMNSGKSLASTVPAVSSTVEVPSEGSHFNSLQHQTTFAPLTPLCKSKQPSYSQQKIAYIQPYSQPDLMGRDKNSQYFTSQQENSLYHHLRELIKVYKSGYLDKHTLIDIINKKVKKEGWKCLDGQISASIIDEFLDRHEDIKCYIDTDIRIALLQENILYSHIINYMGNLKSNNISLKQIDKDILYNIVKEQVNEYGWENLYSISEKWVDSFLERHSDLKKFVISKEVEKDCCSIEDYNPVGKNTHDPVKLVQVTPPATSNISEKSNMKTPITRPEETDTRSWGIISDVFSLNPSSINETAEYSEKDLELLSLSSSFRKVTTESSKTSAKFRNTPNIPIRNKKKELENKLSLLQLQFKNLPRKPKPFLSTTSRIADAVTSRKDDAVTTSRIADSVTTSRKADALTTSRIADAVTSQTADAITSRIADAITTSQIGDAVTTSRKADAVTGSALNINLQNASDTTETETSDVLLPSIESLNKSGAQLKKGGKTRLTVGMTDLLTFTFQHEHFPSSTNMARLAKIMGIHWSRVRNWFTKQRLECKKAEYFVPKDKQLNYCPYCNLALKEPKEQKEHLFHPEHIQKALEEKVQAKSATRVQLNPSQDLNKNKSFERNNQASTSTSQQNKSSEISCIETQGSRISLLNTEIGHTIASVDPASTGIISASLGVLVNSVTSRDVISKLSSQPSKGIKSMAPNLQTSSLSQKVSSNVRETYSTLNNSRISFSKTDITLSAPGSLLTTSEVTSAQDDPLNEDCGITKTFYAKDPTNPEISHKYFIKTKVHEDGKTYEYLYREDGKTNKLIGTKELTEAENSKSTSGDTPLSDPENNSKSVNKVCQESDLEEVNPSSVTSRKNSDFELSRTTNIIPPDNNESQSKNKPQHDQDDRIEDDFLMASEEMSDKVCINCLFEYGDEDAWITCYICSFWLHKHCSVLYDKEGTLICPPCSLKQIPMASGSGAKLDKDTSILKSTSVLTSDQNSDKIVNRSIGQFISTFDKDNPKISVPNFEKNTSGKGFILCDNKGDKQSIFNDTANSRDSKDKSVKEKIHIKDLHCPVCTMTIDKKYWVKCGFCKKIIHKLCGKLFLASSSKAMKWHCPSCKNINPIKYDPKYFQDLIYKIDGVEYECEPQKYLTKKEEVELVLYILGNFNEKRICISKFQKILLSFVIRKDGPFKKDRGSYDTGWKKRFLNRHPMLKEIVSVTDIDNEKESLVGPTSSPKRSKIGGESLAEYVKKELTETSPLKKQGKTSGIPKALPEAPSKKSSKRLLIGTELETEVTVKKEITEMELSVDEHFLFTITNEMRDIIPVEMLHTGLKDKESIDEENQSTSEILSISSSNVDTTNKIKPNQSDDKSTLSDLSNHCKGKSLSVEKERDNDCNNIPKDGQNLKCSLLKPIRKQKCKFGTKKISIILERLPLELCETVEGRNILVSRSLQNEVDDSAIVCVGCKTNRGSMSSWLGCDSCSAWWHIKCAGLPTNLTKRQIQDMDWNCPTCKKTNELLSRTESNMSKKKYSNKPEGVMPKKVSKEHYKSDSNWPLSILNIIGKCWNCKNCLQILPCEICTNCKDDCQREVKKICESKKCTNPQIRVKGFVERFYFFNNISPRELPELFRLSKKCRECSGCTLPVCGKCINCKRVQRVRKVICKGSKRLCIKKKCVNPIVSLETFVTCVAIELNFKESVIKALKCDQRFSLNYIPYCASCWECRKPNCGQCQYCQEDQFALEKGGCKIKHCMEKMCVLTIKYGSKFIHKDFNESNTPDDGDISEMGQGKLSSTVPSGVFTMTEEADHLDMDLDVTNRKVNVQTTPNQESISSAKLSENCTNSSNQSTLIDDIYDDDLPDLTINDHLYLSPEKGNVQEIKHDSELCARSDVSDEEGDTIPCEGCSYIGGSPFWLCCDGCDGWWHRKCAGIARYTTDEKIQKMVWKCPTCVAQTFLSESKASTEISLKSRCIEQGNKLKISDSDESCKKTKGNRNSLEEYEKPNKNLMDNQKKTESSLKHRKRSTSNKKEYLETDYIDVETLDDSGEDIGNTAKCDDKIKPENSKANDDVHCSECKTVTSGCKDYNDYFKILQKMQLEQLKRNSRFTFIKRAKLNESDTVLEEKEISTKKCSNDICSEARYQSGITHKDHSTDISTNKRSAFLTKSIIEESISDYYKILQKLQVEQLKRKETFIVPKSSKDDEPNTLSVKKVISTNILSNNVCSKKRNHAKMTQQIQSSDEQNTGYESNFFLRKNNIKESIIVGVKEKLLIGDDKTENIKGSSRNISFSKHRNKHKNIHKVKTAGGDIPESKSILPPKEIEAESYKEDSNKVKDPNENTHEKDDCYENKEKNCIKGKLCGGSLKDRFQDVELSDKLPVKHCQPENLSGMHIEEKQSEEPSKNIPFSKNVSKTSIENLDSDSFLDKVTEPGFDPFRLYKKCVFQPKMTQTGEFLGFEYGKHYSRDENFDDLEKSKNSYIKSNNIFSDEEWFTDEELGMDENTSTKFIKLNLGNDVSNMKYIEDDKSNNANEYKCGDCRKHPVSTAWVRCNSCTSWGHENSANCGKPQGSTDWVTRNSCNSWRHDNCAGLTSNITLNQLDNLSQTWNCYVCVKSKKESLFKESGGITSNLIETKENITNESEINENIFDKDGKDESKLLPKTSDVTNKIIHEKICYTKGELLFKSKDTGIQIIDDNNSFEKGDLLYDINDADNKITDENNISEKGKFLLQRSHAANKINEKYISAERVKSSFKTNNIDKISDGNISKEKILLETSDAGNKITEKIINSSNGELLFDTNDDGCEITNDVINEDESIIDTAVNLSGISKSEISENNYNSTNKNHKRIFLDFAQVVDTSLSEIREKVKKKEYKVLGFTKGNGANITVTECSSSNVNGDKCIVSFAKVIDNDISENKEHVGQGICNNKNVCKDGINSRKSEVLYEMSDVVLGIGEIVIKNDKDEILGDSLYSSTDSDDHGSFLGFDLGSIMRHKSLNDALGAHIRQELCTEFINNEGNTKIQEQTDVREEIKNSMNEYEIEDEKLLNEIKYKANCKEIIDETKLNNEKMQSDLKVNSFLGKNNNEKVFYEERKENDKKNIEALKEKKKKVLEEDNQIKCFGCGKCRDDLQGNLVRCNSCTCWWHRTCGGAHRVITPPGQDEELSWSCPLCVQDNTPWTITNETLRDDNGADNNYVPQPCDMEESFMYKTYGKSNNDSESSQRQFEMEVTSAPGKMVYISNIPIEKDISKRITWEKGKSMELVESTELVKNTEVINTRNDSKHLEKGFSKKISPGENTDEDKADEKCGSASAVMSCIDVSAEKELTVITNCGGCLTDLKAVSKWISCETCGCLWHKRCAKESEKVTLGEIKEIEWHCPICLETSGHIFLESTNVFKLDEIPMKNKEIILEAKETFKLPQKIKIGSKFLAKNSSNEYLMASRIANSNSELSSGLTEKPEIAQLKQKSITKQTSMRVTHPEQELIIKQTSMRVTRPEQESITKQSSMCVAHPQDKEGEESLDKECVESMDKESSDKECVESTNASEMKTINYEIERNKTIESCDNDNIGCIARRAVTRPAWMQSGEFSGYGRLKTDLKKKKKENKGEIKNICTLKTDSKKKKKGEIISICSGCQSDRGQKKSWIKCCKCFRLWHRKCTDLSKHSYASLMKKNTWNCAVCLVNGFKNKKMKASNIVTYKKENITKSNNMGNVRHTITKKKKVKPDSKIITKVEDITKVEEMIRYKKKSIKIDRAKITSYVNLKKNDFKRGDSSYDKSEICEFDDNQSIKQSEVTKTRKNRKVSGSSPKAKKLSKPDLALPVLSNCWDTMSTLFLESDLSETTLADNANDSMIDIPNTDVDFTYIDTDLTAEETDKLNVSQSDLNILTAALDGLGNEDLKLLNGACNSQKILNDLENDMTLSQCNKKKVLTYTDNTCNTSINTQDNQFIEQPSTSPGKMKDNVCTIPVAYNDTNKNIQDRGQNPQSELLENENKSKICSHPSAPMLKMPKLVPKKKKCVVCTSEGGESNSWMNCIFCTTSWWHGECGTDLVKSEVKRDFYRPMCPNCSKNYNAEVSDNGNKSIATRESECTQNWEKSEKASKSFTKNNLVGSESPKYMTNSHEKMTSSIKSQTDSRCNFLKHETNKHQTNKHQTYTNNRNENDRNTNEIVFLNKDLEERNDTSKSAPDHIGTLKTPVDNVLLLDKIYLKKLHNSDSVSNHQTGAISTPVSNKHTKAVSTPVSNIQAEAISEPVSNNRTEAISGYLIQVQTEATSEPVSNIQTESISEPVLNSQIETSFYLKGKVSKESNIVYSGDSYPLQNFDNNSGMETVDKECKKFSDLVNYSSSLKSKIFLEAPLLLSLTGTTSPKAYTYDVKDTSYSSSCNTNNDHSNSCITNNDHSNSFITNNDLSNSCIKNNDINLCRSIQTANKNSNTEAHNETNIDSSNIVETLNIRTLDDETLTNSANVEIEKSNMINLDLKDVSISNNFDRSFEKRCLRNKSKCISMISDKKSENRCLNHFKTQVIVESVILNDSSETSLKDDVNNTTPTLKNIDICSEIHSLHQQSWDVKETPIIIENSNITNSKEKKPVHSLKNESLTHLDKEILAVVPNSQEHFQLKRTETRADESERSKENMPFANGENLIEIETTHTVDYVINSVKNKKVDNSYKKKEGQPFDNGENLTETLTTPKVCHVFNSVKNKKVDNSYEEKEAHAYESKCIENLTETLTTHKVDHVMTLVKIKKVDNINSYEEKETQEFESRYNKANMPIDNVEALTDFLIEHEVDYDAEVDNTCKEKETRLTVKSECKNNNISIPSAEELSDSLITTELDDLINLVNSGVEVNSNYNAKEILLAVGGDSNEDGPRQKAKVEELTDSLTKNEVDHLINSGMKPEVDNSYKKIQHTKTNSEVIAFDSNQNCEAASISRRNDVLYPACSASSYNIPILDIGEVSDFSHVEVTDDIITDVLDNYVSIDVASLHAICDYDDIGNQKNLYNEKNWSLDEYSPVRKKRLDSEYANISNKSVDIGNSHIRVTSDVDNWEIPSNYIITGIATVALNGDEHNIENLQKKCHNLYTYTQLMDMYKEDKRRLLVHVERLKVPFDFHKKSSKRKMSEKDTVVDSKIKNEKKSDVSVHKSQEVSKLCRKRTLSVRIKRLELSPDECFPKEFDENIHGNLLSSNISSNQSNTFCQNKKSTKSIKEHSKSMSSIKCDVKTVDKIYKKDDKKFYVKKDNNKNSISKSRSGIKLRSLYKTSANICKPSNISTGVIINAGKILKRAPIRNENHNTLIVVNSKTKSVSVISNKNEIVKKSNCDKSISCTNNVNLSHNNIDDDPESQNKKVICVNTKNKDGSSKNLDWNSSNPNICKTLDRAPLMKVTEVVYPKSVVKKNVKSVRKILNRSNFT